MPDVPIVCTLSEDGLRARKQGLLGQVARRATVLNKISGGYRLEFAAEPGILPLMTSLIEAERECCRFLRFTLTVEPNLGPMVLELTGPNGTQELFETILETT